ncbi:hypothetical protein ACVR1G_03895 [Streptococcus dentasini]
MKWRRSGVLAVGLILLLVLGALLLSFSSVTKGSEQPIYGVTIDDTWEGEVTTDAIVQALEDMPVRPTVRIVMSKEKSPRSYVSLFKKIAPVADIMAQPVDSYDMNAYPDPASYRQRFRESLKYLKDYTKIWEVGNEINGIDWIKQDPELIVDKVQAAYDLVEASDQETAVTFYYENPKDHDMLTWIDRYIPRQMTQGLDFSFISYYEDDNGGYQPDWQTVFKKFQGQFAKSKVGMGECGNTAPSATRASKIAMMRHYYQQPVYTKHYVGGYFWWNWVQDCVSYQHNQVHEEFNHILKQEK